MSKLRSLDIESLLSRLDELGGGPDAALCFDADGTLWSGDVGEDVFQFAIEHGLFREAARSILDRFAHDAGLAPSESLSVQAQHLLDGFFAEQVSEQAACIMMAVCFAGWDVAELTPRLREALDTAQLGERLFAGLAPVFDWARRTQTATFVISASPDFVVHVAAEHWSFAPVQIAGCEPNRHQGRILDSLAFPLPYNEEKVSAAQRLLKGRRWLASFGDNVFDSAMLQAAHIGVAVQPKPRLEQRLAELQGVWLLE